MVGGPYDYAPSQSGPWARALTLSTPSGRFQLLLSRFLSGFFYGGVGRGEGREAWFWTRLALLLLRELFKVVF